MTSAINLSSLLAELRNPAAELLPILHLCDAADGIPVSARKTDESGLSVSFSGKAAEITFSEPAFFFRALGLLADMLRDGEPGSVSEKPSHKTLGPMLDCSRNAVPTVEAVKRMVRHIALMGHNALMLYTEDTFEVDGEPYFGYMRGRYSKSELREIDAYCASFGIELIPCIQALAHLGEALKWGVYEDIRDLGDILLADEPKTYEFLDRLMKTVSETFTSRRINLGMDEAWMLGQGKYLDRHGLVSKSDIMRSHLSKIAELCRRYGFSPMMWSDMFFLKDADGNPRDRYDYTSSLPADIHSVPPREMGLIYWDYYNGEKRVYDGVIEMHQKFDNEVCFAGGAWKWVGFAPMNHYSFTRSVPAVRSCFEHGVTSVFVTAWGDNGAECPAFAVLPTFQLYAEGCFTGDMSKERVARRFATCTGGIMEDFMMLDMPQLPAGNFDSPTDNNPAKYITYADPMIGLADAHIGPDYSSNYRKYAEYLDGAEKRNPDWAYLFKNSAALCRLLSSKADISIRMKAAYDAGDRDTLSGILADSLPTLLNNLDCFRETFRAQWYTENKTFGYEVIDLRLGGLHSRTLSTIRRLSEYLEGSINELPELSETRLRFDCRSDENAPTDTHRNNWGGIVSTCVL